MCRYSDRSSGAKRVRQARKERVQIRQYVRVGVLLDQKRSRSVADKEGEQSRRQSLPFRPLPDLIRHFVKTATRSAPLDLDGCLPHLSSVYAQGAKTVPPQL